jgi:hypothetical protein
VRELLPGALARMYNIEPQPLIVTIIRKARHPYHDFLSAYKVLGENGKTYSVSETFLRSIT